MLLTGCASMVCGSKQAIGINSKPAGAEVLVYDPHGEIVFQNTTPCIASLIRSAPEIERANYIILIRKQGYAPVQIPLTSRLNGAYLANVLNGGVGMIVDSFAGTMWTLSAEGLDPKLVDENAAILHAESDLTIALKPSSGKGLLTDLEPVQSQPIALEALARTMRTSGE